MLVLKELFPSTELFLLEKFSFFIYETLSTVTSSALPSMAASLSNKNADIPDIVNSNRKF